ncbi:hypothetical protein PGT21_020647 [Puccinia graminis f. sp. tritici]|uniref:Uncharacterized protein n=1 Tax=Puccinia graminis f. sp. tritici TaxID=56615 RepID=A0A5B0QFQ4_PUCGR|nr:hypothetical protein PGT21_020647 [Puccinia graminis f. sp. tritici]
MSYMNVFQRGYITLAFIAFIITLHSVSGQVRAYRLTKQQCGYHFSPTSSLQKGRSSCKQNDKDDHLCMPNSCYTDKGGARWEAVFFIKCYKDQIAGAQIKRDTLKPAQYFRRESFAEVQEVGTQIWFTCPYSYDHNAQIMTCGGCQDA